VSEVDVLARLEPKGHLGVLVEQEWDDWFVIFESPGPFSLALGVRTDTVDRHHVQNACARAQSRDDLLVPIYAWLKIATIKPYGNTGRARSKLIGQREHDIFAIATRITDEIKRFGHQ